MNSYRIQTEKSDSYCRILTNMTKKANKTCTFRYPIVIFGVQGEQGMVISFGARNYLSFKEGFEVSLAQSTSNADHLSGGQGVSNVACIIGANASGKTNVLRALAFVSDFCCNSFSNKPEDELAIVSFDYNKQASTFFVEFMIEGIRYYYEAELTSTEVVSEMLERKASRWTKIFSRNRLEIEYCIKELKELALMKLRKNVSVISSAHQYEIIGLEKIYAFFSAVISNFDPIWGEVQYNGQTANIKAVTKRYKESTDMLEFVRTHLAAFDTGIQDIIIEEVKDPTGTEYYFPIFRHRTTQSDVLVPYILESNGTRSLYAQLSLFKQVLDCGGVLLIDEFDNNLHPEIHEKLIGMFLQPQDNPNNAQLIFCTHNTSVMDRLGKHRVVLVNKEENESFLYRVDELPGTLVRNDRSLEAIYKTGKLGGVPKL